MRHRRALAGWLAVAGVCARLAEAARGVITMTARKHYPFVAVLLVCSLSAGCSMGRGEGSGRIEPGGQTGPQPGRFVPREAAAQPLRKTEKEEWVTESGPGRVEQDELGVLLSKVKERIAPFTIAELRSVPQKSGATDAIIMSSEQKTRPQGDSHVTIMLDKVAWEESGILRVRKITVIESAKPISLYGQIIRGESGKPVLGLLCPVDVPDHPIGYGMVILEEGDTRLEYTQDLNGSWTVVKQRRVRQ